MRGEHQRIVITFVRRPFFAIRDAGGVGFQAKVVQLDLVSVVKQFGGEATGQCRLANSFGAGKKQGLGNAVPADHLLQGFDHAGVAVEVFQGSS